MKVAFLAVLIASFTSVSLAGLAGIAPNAAATTATGGRESIFDLVTINPTSGQASTTQKRIFAPVQGTLDFSNVLFSENGQWVLSLQNHDQSAGMINYIGSNPVNPANNPQYLARQDLAEGGVYEFCSITGAYSPINIFWDTDRSVIATAVGNGIFALVRYSFDDTRATCTSSIITPLAGFNSIVANLRASRASGSARIIYFVTEPANGFSTTTNTAPQIRSFSVSGTNAVPLFTVSLTNGLFPVTLAALSDEVVAFQAWTATLSGTTAGFGTYEVNLRTFLTTTVLAARAIASTGAGVTEELSFTQTFVNQTNTYVTLKGVQTTSTLLTNFHVASTSFATAGSAESRVANALNNQFVFHLFDLANATISNVAVDNTQGGNFAVITGTATFAGTQSLTSVSRCRFTHSGSSSFANAVGAGDRVSCLPPTTPTTIGTQVDLEFAADGVNYNARTSYSHNGVAAGARFARTIYNLRDGTAIEAGAAPVTVELLDAAGRRILFANSVTVTLNVASTGGAAIRGVVGNSATSTTSGIATFPGLAIDVDAADADGIARVTLSATFSGATSSTTATANVRLINRTRGTLAALAFPSVATGTQAFETQLIDPRNNANTQRIATRTQIDTSSTGGIALGLVAYDNENKILNTVEISSTNGLVLSGSALGGSFTRGTGACTIPNSANNANDAPTSIWYEKTNLNTDGTVASVDFLAIVNTVDSATTAQGRRIVRINRLQGSLQATACRLTEVDRIPIFDSAYGNHITLPLSSGRNVNAIDRIAFVEPDYYFPTTGASVLNVWRITTTSTPGAWVIRNKVLRGFQVNAVTQSATNELAFSGQSVPVSIPVKIGIYLVDISAQTSPIVPANTQTVFPQQATEFASTATNSDTALFLVAGSADSLGASRYRFTGAATAAGAQQLLTNHLARATATLTPDVARAVELSTNSTFNARNYVDFFNIDDPVITAVSPSALAISATTTPVTVTANNVIVSGQLRCRFTTEGVTSVEVTTNAAATLEVAADGRTVTCGNLPSTFAGQNRFVYVQLSNDGGLTYGPEAILLVGSPVRPTNFGPAPVVSVVPNAPATRTFSIVLETSHTFAPNTAQVNGIETVVNSILAAFDGVTRSTIANSQTSGASTTTYSFTVTSTTADRIQRAVLGLNANLANLLAAFSLTGSNGPALTAAGVTRASVVEGISATTSTDDDGLSDGAIAGIVIGSVIGGLLLIGGAIFALTRAGASKTTGSSYNARDVSRIDGSSSGSSYDSDYSDYDYSEETDGDYDESDDEDYSDYV